MIFDQVIIGASTSGLFAAKLLAEAGQRVAVFDSQRFQNPTRRTYIITPHLKPILGFLPEQAIIHSINTIAVQSSYSNVEIQLKDPDLIVERKELSSALANLAQAAGVRIFWGHRFLEMLPENNHDVSIYFLRQDRRRIQVNANAIIGADGVFSKVRQTVGLKPPPFVPINQAEINLPKNWDPSVTKVWFDTQDTPFFYWLIPENEKTGVVGLVGDNYLGTKKLLNKFLVKHNFQPTAYQGGVVAMHHPTLRSWETFRKIPVFLIGDAAGQVKVTTVGGTVTGFWGARAAVKSILDGSSYQKNLRSLRRELHLHWYMRALLERLDNPGYDQLVNSIDKPVQSFLADRNRDQMASAFWKLPIIQPRLLQIGFRCIFGKNQRAKLRNYQKVSVTD